jgi:hypothetical protein
VVTQAIEKGLEYNRGNLQLDIILRQALLSILPASDPIAPNVHPSEE